MTAGKGFIKGTQLHTVTAVYRNQHVHTPQTDAQHLVFVAVATRNLLSGLRM